MNSTEKNKNMCMKMLKNLYEYYSFIDDPRKFAYSKAIATLMDLDKDLFKEGTDFTTYSGIGAKINEKLTSLIRTGDYSDEVDEIFRDYAFIRMKSVSNPHKHYMTKSDALRILRRSGLLPLIQDFKFDYLFAGSMRRGNSLIGDVDIIITNVVDADFSDFLEELMNIPKIRVDAKGRKKLKLVILDGNNAELLEVDIRFCSEECLGTMTLYYTGPADFNIGMRAAAKAKGFKLSEYGILDDSDVMHTFEFEKDVFKFLGRTYIDPMNR